MPQYTADQIEKMEFGIWLDNGVRRGWITLPVCVNHDVLPLTKEELESVTDGDDPCVHVVRLWR